jgi:hypothetical protein
MKLNLGWSSQGVNIMDNDKTKELCLSLLKADTEEDVILILREAGYWNEPSAWRYYGDYENNYNSIGNQQGRPDAALVEKLVNSVDARLMNECFAKGVDSEGNASPPNIRQAVARFFDEEMKPDSPSAGIMKEWTDAKRTSIARGITLTATGNKPPGNPSFTISDCGEGQTPEMMPSTLLSLTKSNKLRIPFVQGKFNMGGTGALVFCGENNLQLILSRRNPSILKNPSDHPTDSQWGFTIVRREYPEKGRRSSVYTYLAPLDTEDINDGVLRYTADEMPIFPEGNDPYTRMSRFGTLIKLYEYSVPGHKSHILLPDGILSRMDILLPDVALPIRLHEARDYRGSKGSFETTLTGLSVRLEDDKKKNLEDGFPDSTSMSVSGEKMAVTIYAFKKKKAETYRKNEGIIFTLNGQTQGQLTKDFFRRGKKVGLGYLADSILVKIDCSHFSGKAREVLFMNSRDRLRGGELRIEIERALEDLLKNHSGLRALKEKRRREEIESKLDDSKPLEEILESLLKDSPTLSALFLKGQKITTPFKPRKVQAEDKHFKGKRFPTYFRFKGKEYGACLTREAHLNMRCRISFETDVENEYFDRDVDPGQFDLYLIKEKERLPVIDHTLNLQNGIATLSIPLPQKSKPSESLDFIAHVSDRTMATPFENKFIIHVKDAAKTHGGKGNRQKPPSPKPGSDRELPSGIQLPNIIKVDESEWESKNPPFNQFTALRIVNAGIGNDDEEEGSEVYDFHINMDNIYLKSELKAGGGDPKITQAQFEYGMVLIGLAMLHQHKTYQHPSKPDMENGVQEGEQIEDQVEKVSSALATIILPAINSLGSLDLGEIEGSTASGESV